VLSLAGREEPHGRISLVGGGLRYNGNVIGSGAQTERRGDAGPVRLLLGGEDSPAAFFPISGPLAAGSAARAGAVGYNGLTGTTLLEGGPAVPITVEATYENGVLKPAEPLPLKEHEKVRITVHPRSNWVEETYGILGWKGDPQELRQLALSPELDLEEEP
jgi:predicted DNA-binding antitoxin AbrB/MazE fold protein